MPLDMQPKIIKDLSEIEQDYLLELWEIDLTGIRNKNGDVGQRYLFHNGLSAVKKNVIFAGKEYIAYPIQAKGFTKKSNGTSARPTLSVSNLYGLATGIIREFDGGVGAKVTRTQVYAKYLDAVNFAGGNKYADPTASFPPENFIIEQVSGHSHDVVTFTLSLPSETDGAMIPIRIITSSTCYWQYRGYGCGYTGKTVCDEKGNPTTDSSKDGCPHTIDGCKLHFGEKAVLPFGGFPSASKVQ